MSEETLLDGVVIPRANGSEGLQNVADFIQSTLDANGAEVTLHSFMATPHGFQLVWSVTFAIALCYVAAIIYRCYGIALVLALSWPVLLLAEFEFMRSPISGLLPLTEHNIIGTFPGRSGGPTLIFAAHYDTTTHFGDHFSWYRWGLALGPATGLAVVVALWGLIARGRKTSLPRLVERLAAALVIVPFAGMTWMQAVGPVIRTPSPGALDNGGSVVALLKLSERLQPRSPGAPTTVKLVFPAAEEERAFGSWAFAETLGPNDPIAVVNLETIGASDDLAFIPEDGFELRRYTSPPELVRLLDETSREVLQMPLPPLRLLGGTFTDGRSFLAHGIAAVTVRPVVEDGFPRKLHSWRDSRDRLSMAGIDRTVHLLEALVERVDRKPELIEELG